MYTMTVEQTQAFIETELGITPAPTKDAIYRWCKSGVRGVYLPHARIGRSIRINPDDVREYLEVDKNKSA